MPDQKGPPIDVIHLLPILDNHLIQLLHSLQPADWHRQTIAKKWKVKDVIAHLLDGNIRTLSMLRDGYFGQLPVINSNSDLINYLDGLNADWVRAMERVSPAMLVLLHEATGPLYNNHYASIDPFAKSPFAVNWAGEDESLNWMHIAREYTEKWLHQQQVRDTLNDATLLSKELYYPFIDIFMLALPYTYREVDAPEGTVIRLSIPGDTGGYWQIIRTGAKWKRDNDAVVNPASEVIIDAGTAWKLFSKSVRPHEIMHAVEIRGDHHLGEVALSMISVMA